MTIAIASNPSLSGPRLLFSTGSVNPETGYSAYFSGDTTIPGTLCPDWYVIQWERQESATQPEYLNPNDTSMLSAGDFDPGREALYSISSPDDSGRLSVFNDGGQFIYDMYKSVGPETAAASAAYGSPDLGLQTQPGLLGGAPITMDHPVTLSIDARIREADVAYASGTTDQPFSATNPLGTAGMGVVVTFNSANLHITLFLQAELADSRFNTTPVAYQNTSSDGYTTTVIYHDVNASEAMLPYVTGDTPEKIDWNINAMLEDALQGVPTLAANASQLDNLAGWDFSSTYVGLEMGGINAPTIQGTASLDLQLSNLNLTTDPTTEYSAATAPNGGNALISSSYGDAPKIEFVDSTSGLSGVTYGEAYDGPVAGIKSEYLYDGSDAMSFIIPADTYIVGGPGNDCIAATSGNNVIDGGGGSNWLTSGSGDDTFFVSGLSGQSTWDCILNFHPGDMATIWGNISNIKWADDQGAPGYKGLTLFATGSQGQSVGMTFPGLTTADLAHFSVSSGQIGANAYLLIGDSAPASSH